MILCVSLGIGPLLHPEYAEAHRMIIEEVEEGIVLVRYDDGTEARVASVSTFNQEGEVVAEGTVDENGRFHYDKDIDAYRFVADDGLGHRATWVNEEDEETTGLASVPLPVRAILGVSVCLFVAAIFLYRRKS